MPGVERGKGADEEEAGRRQDGEEGKKGRREEEARAKA